MSYQSDLQDPRWQRKRLEIFQRDEFQCLRCGAMDRMLTVHHRSYFGRPWEAPEFEIETLCEPCHHKEHSGGDALSLFALRQMIQHAHDIGDWDHLWRLCHLLGDSIQ